MHLKIDDDDEHIDLIVKTSLCIIVYHCVLPSIYYDLANSYGGTERRTDGRTDTAVYRDAQTHLKRISRQIDQ